MTTKYQPYTRAEILTWPPMGPMNLDMYRMLATVESREGAIAQGQADHCALADALGWGGEFNHSTLPPPWRAVTELIKERDKLRAQVEVLQAGMRELEAKS